MVIAGRKSRKLLHDGDRMTQPDFHRAYLAMPENYRAELIGGIVHEPSPLGWPHGSHHARLICICENYAGPTRGLEVADGATVILGNEDEVQPDVVLRIMPEYGGQSKNTRIKKATYAAGAPELVAEVAHSSRDIDLNRKKERYTVAGVLEYVVVCLEPLAIYWFDLSNNRELNCGPYGVFKSEVFPGLWIHGDALLQLDYECSMCTLNQGLKTPEYRDFADKLARRKIR